MPLHLLLALVGKKMDFRAKMYGGGIGRTGSDLASDPTALKMLGA